MHDALEIAAWLVGVLIVGFFIYELNKLGVPHFILRAFLGG